MFLIVTPVPFFLLFQNVVEKFTSQAFSSFTIPLVYLSNFTYIPTNYPSVFEFIVKSLIREIAFSASPFYST